MANDKNNAPKMASVASKSFNTQTAPQDQQTYLWFSRKEASRFHTQILAQFPQGSQIDESAFDRIQVQLPTPQASQGEKQKHAILGEDLLSYDIALDRSNGHLFQYSKMTNSATPPKGYQDYQLVTVIKNSDFLRITEHGKIEPDENNAIGFTQVSQINSFKEQIKNFYEPWDGYLKAAVPEINNNSEQPLNAINELIGLDTAKNRSSEFYHLASLLSAQAELGLETEHPITNLVISGARGTGKNTYAEHMAKAYKEWNMVHNDTYIEVTSDQILGEYMGNTDAMIKTKLQEAEGGILHIKITDNIYASNLTGRDYGQEIVNALTKPLLDHQNFATIFISGQTEVISELLEHANGDFISEVKTVYIEPFNEKDLSALLKKTFDESAYSITPQAFKVANELLIKTKKTVPENQFANGHTVNHLFKAMVRKLATRLSRSGALKNIRTKNHDLMAKKVTTITKDDIKDITPASITKADANKTDKSPYSNSKIGFLAAIDSKPQSLKK